MSGLRRDLEVDPDLTGPEIERRLDDITESPLGALGCAELRDRLLDLKSLGMEMPQRNFIVTRLRQLWQRAAGKLIFFAGKNGCLSEDGRHELSRLSRQMAGALGHDEVFEIGDEFERAITEGFEWLGDDVDPHVATGDELKDALEEIVGNVRATEHLTEWTFDFDLPGVEDAPFASSMTYDPDENVITGVALRFSPDLLERVPEPELLEEMQGLILQTDPPSGTIWQAYIRGDAQVSGPHIIAPGGFSSVGPDEFIDWLPQLIDQRDDAFGV